MKTSQTETEQRLSIRHTSHKNRLLIIGIVCSFILFVFYAFNSWRAADKDLEKGALAYAQTIEVALNTVRL
jgi:predicted negative regulator of RcsB-dependent stress response